MTRTHKSGFWLQLALLPALATLASSSHAATVTATVANDKIGPGDSTEIQIRLNLPGGEDASIFEGRFDLIGSGVVVEEVLAVDLTAGGPSWTTAFGDVVAQQAQVSLTSANAGGSRLVATLTVTGLDPGTFDVELGSGTMVQRDLPGPPFFEDVPLTTPIGTVLATVTVIAPLPALGGPGLAILVGLLLLASRGLVAGRVEARA